MTKPLMLHDPDHEAVKELQRSLLILGETLPRWGVDGDLGHETLAAARDALAKHGVVHTASAFAPSITEQEHSAILSFASAILSFADVPPPPKLIDRRSFAMSAGRSKDGGQRAWTRVKGPCLHQTACWLSSSKDPARSDGIGSHFVVYPDGTIFWLHDLDRVIWAANTFNELTYSIEIDGLFAGVEGDPSTVWHDPEGPTRVGSVTPEQIEATKHLVRWCHAMIRSRGGWCDVIVPHRMSSLDRRNDPGSKVWKEIGIPLRDELGLSDGGPGDHSAGGYMIPEAWDPTRVGIPY